MCAMKYLDKFILDIQSEEKSWTRAYEFLIDYILVYILLWYLFISAFIKVKNISDS